MDTYNSDMFNVAMGSMGIDVNQPPRLNNPTTIRGILEDTGNYFIECDETKNIHVVSLESMGSSNLTDDEIVTGIMSGDITTCGVEGFNDFCDRMNKYATATAGINDKLYELNDIKTNIVQQGGVSQAHYDSLVGLGAGIENRLPARSAFTESPSGVNLHIALEEVEKQEGIWSKIKGIPVIGLVARALDWIIGKLISGLKTVWEGIGKLINKNEKEITELEKDTTPIDIKKFGEAEEGVKDHPEYSQEIDAIIYKLQEHGYEKYVKDSGTLMAAISHYEIMENSKVPYGLVAYARGESKFDPEKVISDVNVFASRVKQLLKFTKEYNELLKKGDYDDARKLSADGGVSSGYNTWVNNNTVNDKLLYDNTPPATKNTTPLTVKEFDKLVQTQKYLYNNIKGFFGPLERDLKTIRKYVDSIKDYWGIAKKGHEGVDIKNEANEKAIKLLEDEVKQMMVKFASLNKLTDTILDSSRAVRRAIHVTQLFSRLNKALADKQANKE